MNVDNTRFWEGKIEKDFQYIRAAALTYTLCVAARKKSTTTSVGNFTRLIFFLKYFAKVIACGLSAQNPDWKMGFSLVS